MDIHVSLPAEAVFHIGPVPIYNSYLAAFFITFLVLLFAIITRGKFKTIPGRFQAFLEMILNFVMDQLRAAFGSERRARKFLPLIMTLFIFITLANQLSVLPFIYQVTYNKSGILRTATADLTLTMMMALMVVGLSQIIAFAKSPLAHIGKYIKLKPFLKVRSVGDFGNAILELFLGLLDIIGEIAKVLSMSFRLFGNVFAGEVLVLVITGLSAYTRFIVPIPFMAISIFSGFVQAFVFMLLSIQFIAGTIGDEEAPAEEKKEAIPAQTQPEAA